MTQVIIPDHLPITIDSKGLRAIAEHHQVKEFALFGSVVRSDFTAESDVDVLVTFQEDRLFVRLFELFDIQFALEDLFRRPVDLVPIDALNALLASAILSRKVVIYVATPGPSVPDSHARRVSAH